MFYLMYVTMVMQVVIAQYQGSKLDIVSLWQRA